MRVLILLVLLAGCRTKCPKCAPPLPPRVVEVTKPCMEAPPVLVVPTIPDPDADGTIHLTLPELRKLLILLGELRGYVTTQLERCGPRP